MEKVLHWRSHTWSCNPALSLGLLRVSLLPEHALFYLSWVEVLQTMGSRFCFGYGNVQGLAKPSYACLVYKQRELMTDPVLG